MTQKKEISKTYENRLLLFADFMGFSDFINQTLEEPNKIDYIHRLFDVTSSMLAKIKSLNLSQLEVDQTRLSCRMFSDNITVSVPYTSSDDLILITSWACILQYTIFSESEFFLRGSIVYSQIYDYDNKIFGPALIRAYNLERKKAVWQRIILDDAIIKLNTELNPYFDYYIKEGKIYFLDYLRYLYRIFGVNEYRGINKFSNFRPELPGSVELFAKHKKKIMLAISSVDNSQCSVTEKRKRLRKYNELSKYHNDVLDSYCLIVDDFLSNRDLTYDICRAIFKQAYLETLNDYSFKSPYTVEDIRYKDVLPIFFIANKDFFSTPTPSQATTNGITTLDRIIDDAANHFFAFSQSSLKTFKSELCGLKLPYPIQDFY